MTLKRKIELNIIISNYMYNYEQNILVSDIVKDLYKQTNNSEEEKKYILECLYNELINSFKYNISAEGIVSYKSSNESNDNNYEDINYLVENVVCQRLIK